MIKSELDFEQFKKEADLLKIISQHNHPHIIKYYDSCVLGRAGEFSDLKIAYILLEKGITSLDKIVCY